MTGRLVSVGRKVLKRVPVTLTVKKEASVYWKEKSLPSEQTRLYWDLALSSVVG